nr:type III pantothenate kinase [Chloroflexota bacterium]
MAATPAPKERKNNLLCLDIGNSNVVLGLWEKDQWLAHWRVRTIRDQMPDEYAVLLKALLRNNGYDFKNITRVVMASVVPPLTVVFQELFQRYMGIEPLIVNSAVKTGLRICIDNPPELGADLLADAVAAYHRFRGACIVVDFGTATTFSAVSKEGDFLGVAIALGLGVAAEALAAHTAQLPRVALVPPPAAIGKNTVHSMQSGLIFGYVGLVKELLHRIRTELGGAANVIATGGLSSVLAPLVEEIDAVDPWLTLDGLRLISELNKA